MFHNQLTEQEREHILSQLKLYATDETLTAALQDTYRGRKHIIELYAELKNTKTKPVAVPTRPMPLKEILNAAESINIQTVHEGPAAIAVDIIKNGPPGEPAGRIAESTKKTIFDILSKSPATTAEINEKLNGSLSNTGRVMKLLWTRKLVSYTDGKFTKV